MEKWLWKGQKISMGNPALLRRNSKGRKTQLIMTLSHSLRFTALWIGGCSRGDTGRHCSGSSRDSGSGCGCSGDHGEVRGKEGVPWMQGGHPEAKPYLPGVRTQVQGWCIKENSINANVEWGCCKLRRDTGMILTGWLDTMHYNVRQFCRTLPITGKRLSANPSFCGKSSLISFFR